LPHTDAHWRYFLEIAGRADVLAEPRFADVTKRTENIDALYETLANIVAQRTTADWLALLDPEKVPFSALNSPDELIENPQLAATGFWRLVEHPSEGTLRIPDIPVAFSESPGGYRRPAPRLGEHSIELLREAGLEEAEIDQLLAQGITVDGAPKA
jgi:crotonobetainyl-CoA:carnitine CoA-transferase CaiB-like acyl-CoA transferase